ncbi:MAG: chromosomal replication initiator protein DnaA [Lachnospiraceae bacterium]|nr:chromosomal replication initiator protein DnaA [Lachnospiraceae bacterium]
MFQKILDNWDVILDTLKQEFELTSVSFRTWIQPLKPCSLQGNELTVTVPSQVQALKFIKKNYQAKLSYVVSEVMDEEIEVNFVLDTSVSAAEDSGQSNPAPVVQASLEQRMLEANINSKYTFDTFVVGGNNNFAHAAALAVAESPAEIYNPLFIYGGVGLGKTHLMHSIARFILENNPDVKVLYTTSEAFTNELINIIRNQNQEAIAAFRSKYRNIDVLLVDDIQFIIGKDRSQEEFFHTFNTLFLQKKQIVISSDKPPKEMNTLDARLTTRFESGLTVDIQSPDYETRMAILRKKADSEHYDISDDILQYIANHITSNIRELEGALTKIVAYSKLSPIEMDLNFAQNALKDIISPGSEFKITISYIIRAVADEFGISPNDLTSKKRTQDLVYARHICMYLCRTLTDNSLDNIGMMLGKRDHSTVIHGIERVTDELTDHPNQKTIELVETLTKKLTPE